MTSTLDEIIDAAEKALPLVGSIVGALVPAAGPAAAVAVKIAQGVMAGVPEAEALWARFQSGDIPTQEELDAYAATENAAYDQLMAHIRAKLAAQPPDA